MSQSPLVSIIITARYPIWFQQALESALAQDYPRCEILVVDSSPEGFISEIVEPFLTNSAQPLRRISFNSDQGELYEFATQAAEGKYIKFLSDSDLLLPNSVSELVNMLENHPHCTLAASRRTRIGPKAEILPDILASAPFVNQNSILRGNEVLRYQSTMQYNLIGEMSAVLFRRQDLLDLAIDNQPALAINGEVLNRNEALSLFSKLLAHGDLIWSYEPLVQIRVSKIYLQPGQIENEELVKKQREKIAFYIRSQPGFTADVGATSEVSVATLTLPQHFIRQNLTAQQAANLNLSELSHWLNARRLEPFQLNYLQKTARETPLRLGVVITTGAQQSEQLTRTLASIASMSAINLRLCPVVVGETAPQDRVTFYSASADNRLQTINALLSEELNDWFIFIDAGTQLLASGIIALDTGLTNADQVLAIYADEFFYIDGQPHGMVFRPDFNLDLLLSSPKTMAQHWLFRRELLLAAEGFNTACADAAELELIVRLIESQGAGVIGHVAEPLLMAQLKSRNLAQDSEVLYQHLMRRGYPDAQINVDRFGNYRLRYQHATKPLVSLLILADRNLAPLITCVTTVLEKTRYLNYEIVIVADNQHSPERENWLTSIAQVDPMRIRVVSFGATYQRAGMVNLGAAQARGEYLMLLHSELAITDAEWLDNLLNHGLRPEVAIVGGKQLTAGNKIRHAGYLLGVNGAANEAFRGQHDDQPSFMGRLHLDQNYSAIAGDFMLVRKEIFDVLGGFNDQSPLFDDIDFCLRVREQGLLTVWTPYARVLRTAARRSPYPELATKSLHQLKQQDEDRLFSDWMPLIAHDPAFNSNLSLKSRHFDVNCDDTVSWEPLRRPGLPKFMVHNADMAGCGYYRMITPLQAMCSEGAAEGKVHSKLLSYSELAQFNPDSLIIQRRYSKAFHNWMDRLNNVSQAFKVFELDDYILNVPLKNYHHKDFKQDIKRNLRKSLSYFDRFVVSTVPLAEAFSDMHSNIVVMQNRLPVSWWGDLQSLRNQGRKPRVGWAGGSSHTGDLEMIVDVVKEFANEVEWVFFGMCPSKLKPYVHEIHYGVDIEIYPAKLASLNLDLALAPLEENFFNSCKSNLRLMEYGACGIPVICSDVECYRSDLPVTRVKNRFKDWCDAIRMHLNEPNASEKMGRELQETLRRDWMLTGKNVENWAKAWSPS